MGESSANAAAPASRPSDTEQAILEAAMLLFAEKGFSATTTRQIALAAGVNEVTLFRHFRTKQELFHRILEEIQRLYPPVGAEVPLAERSPEEVLFEFCRSMLQRCHQAPHLVRLMLYAMLDEVHELRDHLIEKRVQWYREMVRDALARLQRSGRCPHAGDPDQLARLLLSQVFGLNLMNLLRLEQCGIQDVDSLARQILSQFVSQPGAPCGHPAPHA